MRCVHGAMLQHLLRRMCDAPCTWSYGALLPQATRPTRVFTSPKQAHRDCLQEPQGHAPSPDTPVSHMMPHSAGAGKCESASLQIDLKGALYNAALAPSACTLAVINLGPSEARVEMMASQFLQLERVHGLGDDDEGEQHLWDDQDQEQVQGCIAASCGLWAIPGFAEHRRRTSGQILALLLAVGPGMRPAPSGLCRDPAFCHSGP